jgi:hypothetical protein
MYICSHDGGIISCFAKGLVNLVCLENTMFLFLELALLDKDYLHTYEVKMFQNSSKI